MHLFLLMLISFIFVVFQIVLTGVVDEYRKSVGGESRISAAWYIIMATIHLYVLALGFGVLLS